MLLLANVKILMFTFTVRLCCALGLQYIFIIVTYSRVLMIFFLCLLGVLRSTSTMIATVESVYWST